MKHIRIKDGTWWPDPNDPDLEWKLRHAPGEVTQKDMADAASVCRYKVIFKPSIIIPNIDIE